MAIAQVFTWPFFLVVFHIRHEGISKRETTHSLGLRLSLVSIALIIYTAVVNISTCTFPWIGEGSSITWMARHCEHSLHGRLLKRIALLMFPLPPL